MAREEVEVAAVPGWGILLFVRTKLTPDNPWGCGRRGFAWHHVVDGGAAHLDCGCSSGVFLASLQAKGIGRLVGVDISRVAVREAHQSFLQVEVIHLAQTVPLPFGDAEFTSVSLLDTLEHVYEQKELLDELYRVLGDGGKLIVTVPGRYPLSFLDLGNLKFLFPRLHRWYYCRTHSRQEYEYRYASNPDGLVGDVSARKRWHEHFRKERLAELLIRSGFVVSEFDGAGFFTRLIGVVCLPLTWLRPFRAAVELLKRLDARWFASMNLFCVAYKQRPRLLASPPATRHVLPFLV